MDLDSYLEAIEERKESMVDLGGYLEGVFYCPLKACLLLKAISREYVMGGDYSREREMEQRQEGIRSFFRRRIDEN